jgi:hypothetical protein
MLVIVTGNEPKWPFRTFASFFSAVLQMLQALSLRHATAASSQARRWNDLVRDSHPHAAFDLQA